MKKYLYILVFIILFIALLFFDMPRGNEMYRGKCLFLFTLFSFVIFNDIFFLMSSFPYLSLMTFFLMLSFALPLFFIKVEFLQLSGDVNLALTYASIGFSCFYLGFWFTRMIRTTRLISPLQGISGDLLKIRLFALMTLLIYFLIKSGLFSFLGQFKESAILIYIGLYIGVISQKIVITKTENIVFWFVLFSEIMIRSLDGLLSYIVVFLVFIFCCLYFFNNLNKLIVGIAFLILWFVSFFINPIKHYYRAEIWYQTEESGIVDRFEKIMDLNKQVADGKLVKSDDESEKESLLWRFSYQLGALALVIEQTPIIVPYWNGSTYILFSKFIPRFLWKDKPKEEMGYKFGTEYGIISKDNKTTSINTPIIAETYINFGLVGVVVVMFLIGVLSGLLNNFVNSNAIDNWSKCVHFAVVFPTIQMESNFSLVFGGFFLNVFLIYFIVKLLK